MKKIFKLFLLSFVMVMFFTNVYANETLVEAEVVEKVEVEMNQDEFIELLGQNI